MELDNFGQIISSLAKLRNNQEAMKRVSDVLIGFVAGMGADDERNEQKPQTTNDK